MPADAAIGASWIVPAAGTPIHNGRIHLADGRISALEYDTAPRDGAWFRDCAILPGFVNAHTHLELSAYHNRIQPGPLWDWLTALIALRRQPDAPTRELAAAEIAARQALEQGVTTIVDISRTGATFAALLDQPIRKVCCFELISGAGDAPRNPDQLRGILHAFAIQAEQANQRGADTVFPAISPHALYTVAWNDLRRCVALAAEMDLPLTMHLAETVDELEWLAHRRGPLADFRARFPTLENALMPQGDIVALLHRCGMSHHRPLLAHCNYADDALIRDLGAAGCSVAYCPRAHHFFGHPPHRFPEMLASGINVCIGTDSLASNDSLSILDELRFLARARPEFPVHDLLALGTANGAKAVGLGNATGDIRPGFWADWTVIPLANPATNDPWLDVVHSTQSPVATYVGGCSSAGTRDRD